MRVAILMLFGLVQAVSGQVASGGDFTIERLVTSNGGGRVADASNTFAITGTAGQSSAGSAKTNSPFSHPVGFWTPDLLPPTSAGVTIAGQVTNHAGAAISGVWLTILSADGLMQTAVTGTFGRFRLVDVKAGHTYVLTVISRRYVFPASPMMMEISNDVSDLTITASPR